MIRRIILDIEVLDLDIRTAVHGYGVHQVFVIAAVISGTIQDRSATTPTRSGSVSDVSAARAPALTDRDVAIIRDATLEQNGLSRYKSLVGIACSIRIAWSMFPWRALASAGI